MLLNFLCVFLWFIQFNLSCNKSSFFSWLLSFKHKWNYRFPQRFWNNSLSVQWQVHIETQIGLYLCLLLGLLRLQHVYAVFVIHYMYIKLIILIIQERKRHYQHGWKYSISVVFLHFCYAQYGNQLTDIITITFIGNLVHCRQCHGILHGYFGVLVNLSHIYCF